MSLEIKKLYVEIEGKEIVKGISLKIEPGTVHAIMGPNGSGKSTLSNAIMGHPKYKIPKGSIFLDKKEITSESPDQRAKMGLFLSMQTTPEISGVTLANFLRVTSNSLTAQNINPFTFHTNLQKTMDNLKISKEFASRYVNSGFSGGEKKRAEILQLLILNPKYAILDETDSGLDVDALKIVGNGIDSFKTKEKGLLLITHYNRLLQFITPDFVHIMVEGKIVQTGGKELSEKIEKDGFKDFI